MKHKHTIESINVNIIYEFEFTSDPVHGNTDGAHREHYQRGFFSGHTTLLPALNWGMFFSVTHLHFSQSLFLLSVHSRFRCRAPERAGWSQSLCSQTPCVYGYGLLAGTAAWPVGPVPETILRHRRQEQRIHILFLFDCGDPFSPNLPEQKYSLALISVLSMYLNFEQADDIFLTAKAL